MTKKKNKPKSTHEISVDALFEQLRQLNLASPAGSNWLESLRERAEKRETGWKQEADSYMHGLTAAGRMSPEVALGCRALLARCVGCNPGAWSFIAPIIWIVIVGSAAVTGREIVHSTPLWVALLILTAVAGGLWASAQPWMQQRYVPRLERWGRPVLMGLVGLITTACVYLSSIGVGYGIHWLSIRQFEADRASFSADPQGFAFLKKFAREQHGIEVVLGNADQSWASTTLLLPDASTASMSVEPGYCHMNMHRANVLRKLVPVGDVDGARWVQGIMMHEFAHCLDVARDMPGFREQGIGTLSIAPFDTKDVQDIRGMIEVEQRDSTVLWREAMADTYAIGYWKVTAQAEAGDLIASLRHKRNTAKHDTVHATMCWIDHAEKAPRPSSIADLFQWADSLRSSAPCELPKTKPEKFTLVERWVKAWS